METVGNEAAVGLVRAEPVELGRRGIDGGCKVGSDGAAELVVDKPDLVAVVADTAVAPPHRSCWEQMGEGDAVFVG